jgi:hypothetical protein
MSIIGLKDLDQKLAEFLSDADLSNLNSINRYYFKIYDDAFYRRRFYQFYNSFPFSSTIDMNIYHQSWKNFYYLVKKWLAESDHVKSICYCIDEDRVDILSLIYIQSKYLKDSRIWDWANEKCFYVVPPEYCLKRDSCKCFQYFNNISVEEYQEYYQQYDPHRIKRFWYENGIMSEEEIMREIIFSFEINCETCYNMFQDKIETDLIFYRLFSISENAFLEYNKPFNLFIKTIPHSKILEYKNIALQKDRLDVVNLLTIYSSPFSNPFQRTGRRI